MRVAADYVNLAPAWEWELALILPSPDSLDFDAGAGGRHHRGLSGRRRRRGERERGRTDGGRRDFADCRARKLERGRQRPAPRRDRPTYVRVDDRVVELMIC